MWLNNEKISNTAIDEYRESLLGSCPNHVVIDDLFNEAKLDTVVTILQQPDGWQTQQHTYSSLYVDATQWQNTPQEQRFVQRDRWQRAASNVNNSAQAFLLFLRSDEFMSVLSRIFKVPLTDTNVAEPEVNTNYFRLGATDFVEQHADDSPGRQICLLLYLNKDWDTNTGGELGFKGKGDRGGKPLMIPPLYNRCVLFDPASEGSEHWVEKLNADAIAEDCCDQLRYNVTSWYWSE